MAKELFNWKGLFINEDQSTAKEEIPEPAPSKQFENKFPDQQQQHFSESTIPNPFLTEILAVYEKGFDSLNSSGFDFFELYKSVIAVSTTNPQSYQMAFTMGKTLTPGLSKTMLLDKANYYISEIEKVHAKFDSDGNAKKAALDQTISSQKQSLSKNVVDLEVKIAELQKELETKKQELVKIDSTTKEQYSALQLKIEANNLAKSKIVESINTVITGINQYL